MIYITILSYFNVQKRTQKKRQPKRRTAPHKALQKCVRFVRLKKKRTRIFSETAETIYSGMHTAITLY